MVIHILGGLTQIQVSGDLTPSYIKRVMELDKLLGIKIIGMSVEELLFAAAFGKY